MSTVAVGLIAVVIYLAATSRLALALFRVPDSPEATRQQLLGLGVVAAILHGAVLYQGIVTAAGVNLGFFNALSLVTWVIVALMLLASLTRPVENLGLITLPTAAIALALTLMYTSERLLPTDRGFGFQVHIILAILAYSLLSIATVQALLLAFQERQLRRKRLGGIMRGLPPLQTMEMLLFQMIGVGFFLLSLAIVSGMMFLEDMFAQHVAHKTVLSICAWVIFGVLLWGRWRFGWRGRVAIRWSLAGFLVLMLAFFGSKLVLELVLGR
jgi:ABC-type uncharacterized transport system permease subunit